MDQKHIQQIEGRETQRKKMCKVELLLKINFRNPNCPFSVPLAEQAFMLKAEEGQEGTKALWIIQE